MANIYIGNNKPHRIIKTSEYNIIFHNNIVDSTSLQS